MNDIVLRLKSFAYEIGTLAAAAALGWLLSPEFEVLFSEHFGSFAFAGIFFPVLIGTVKQVRNWLVSRRGKYAGGQAYVEYRL